MLYVWLFSCLYSLSCCRFLFRLILNRKLLWIFEFSLAPLRKSPIFLLFVFSLFVMYWYFRFKQKLKLKIRFFAVFAVICPFLSQIKRLFSVIYAYIGQTTPHTPHFWHSQGGSALFRKFFIFLFLFFVKYYDFAYSAFLPNFYNFW